LPRTSPDLVVALLGSAAAALASSTFVVKLLE
jgi:hypothetical protein